MICQFCMSLSVLRMNYAILYFQMSTKVQPNNQTFLAKPNHTKTFGPPKLNRASPYPGPGQWSSGDFERGKFRLFFMAEFYSSYFSTARYSVYPMWLCSFKLQAALGGGGPRSFRTVQYARTRHCCIAQYHTRN